MGSSEKGAGRRRAAPCRESKPGVSPPRLQHQPAMPLPPSSLQLAPFVAGDFFFFFFVGRDGGGHIYSTALPLEGNEGAPALKAEVLSLLRGTLPQLPQPPVPPPPQPGLVPLVRERASPVVGPPFQCPQGALTPSGPSLPQPRLPSEPQLCSRTHQW